MRETNTYCSGSKFQDIAWIRPGIMAKPYFAILKYKQPLPSTVYLIFSLPSTEPDLWFCICMIHSNLPFSPIIFLVFRDKSWDPSFRNALSTASLSIIHWAVSFEILLCFFFFFFEGEGNWIGKKPGWGEDAKKAPKDSLYASSSQASDYLYRLWRFVSTPKSPFGNTRWRSFHIPGQDHSFPVSLS